MPDGMNVSTACDSAGGDAIPATDVISSKWGGARANSGGPRPNSGGARPGAGRKPGPNRRDPIPETRLGVRWYVIETYPQAEHRTVHDLARAGWRGYLPLLATEVRDRITPTMRRKVMVPLMPGYVFVQFDRDSLTWGTIRDQCSGVRNILRAPNGKPYPVWPIDAIERLMSEDADRLMLADVRNPPRVNGALVRVADGPFAGHTGVVDACDGLTTTARVEVFGRPVPLTLRWSQFEGAV